MAQMYLVLIFIQPCAHSFRRRKTTAFPESSGQGLYWYDKLTSDDFTTDDLLKQLHGFGAGSEA